MWGGSRKSFTHDTYSFLCDEMRRNGGHTVVQALHLEPIRSGPIVS